MDGVTSTNFKVLAEQTAAASNIAFNNLVSHQNAMNLISAAATASAIEKIGATDIAEAAGLAGLAQIANKTAGNMPPVTP